MSVTYSIADSEVHERMTAIMEECHPRLAEAGVKVGILFASNEDGPAIKSHGYAAIACIKVVSLKDRVSKGYDAEMLIDERDWRGFAHDEQRDSTLDHELSHIDRVDLNEKQLAEARDEDSEAVSWKTDDLNRPKLVMVPGDVQAGDGFFAVVARHGDYAIEFYNISRALGLLQEARKKPGKVAVRFPNPHRRTPT